MPLPLLTAALTRQPLTGEAPIWLMRQAGRYLPEYRAVREKFPDFIKFCLNPEAATEVTLQPITRYDLDAAIIFADILTIPHALGQTVKFTAPAQLEKLHHHLPQVAQMLAPVGRTISLTRAALAPHKAVIGFAGAPFTVASYLLDDKPSTGIPNVLHWQQHQPAAWQRLMEILTEATVAYLSLQIEAGADAVQLFDSWAGSCPPQHWVASVHGPLATITARLKATYPHMPVILFARGASQNQLLDFATQVPAALGLGQMVDMAWAATNLQPHTAIQGNLDPLLFAADDFTPLEHAIRQLHTHTQTRPGHVWNVGHGLTPATHIGHVQLAVDLIRSLG
jgi:uroporphyrinogen decarboxylase